MKNIKFNNFGMTPPRLLVSSYLGCLQPLSKTVASTQADKSTSVLANLRLHFFQLKLCTTAV